MRPRDHRHLQLEDTIEQHRRQHGVLEPEKEVEIHAARPPPVGEAAVLRFPIRQELRRALLGKHDGCPALSLRTHGGDHRPRRLALGTRHAAGTGAAGPLRVNGGRNLGHWDGAIFGGDERIRQQHEKPISNQKRNCSANMPILMGQSLH